MKILQEANLQHFVEYALQGHYTHNGVYTISKLNITHVKIMALTEWIYSRLVPENNLRNPVTYRTFQALPLHQRKIIGASMLISRYCIYRILTLFKIYQDAAWTYREVNDYYGTEIEVVMLNPKLAETLDHYLTALRGKDDQKKIEYILLTEYGRLLPNITNKQWFITEVDYRDLEFSNPIHLDRCLQRYYKKILVQHISQTPPFKPATTSVPAPDPFPVQDSVGDAESEVGMANAPEQNLKVDSVSIEEDDKGNGEDSENSTRADLDREMVEKAVKTQPAGPGAEAVKGTEGKDKDEDRSEAVKGTEGKDKDEGEDRAEDGGKDRAEDGGEGKDVVDCGEGEEDINRSILKNVGDRSGSDTMVPPHQGQEVREEDSSHYGYEFVPNVPRYLQEYNLPLGLVSKKGDKYKVIDGYHRIASRIAACPGSRFMVIYCD